jgi:hypothetical protein
MNRGSAIPIDIETNRPRPKCWGFLLGELTMGGSGSGGARKNAGRPPGARSLLKAEARQIAAAKGQDMLDILCGWGADVTLPWEKRLEAIKVALPFLRPRLAAQILQADVHNQIVFKISADDENL